MLLKYVEKEGKNFLYSVENICCPSLSAKLFSKQFIGIFNDSKDRGAYIVGKESVFTMANCPSCGDFVQIEMIPEWPNSPFQYRFIQKKEKTFCDEMTFCCKEMSQLLFGDSTFRVVRPSDQKTHCELLLLCKGIQIPIEYCPQCGTEVIGGIETIPE